MEFYHSKLKREKLNKTNKGVDGCSTLRYGFIFWENTTKSTTVSCKSYFKNIKLLTFPAPYIYDMVIFAKSNLEIFN